MLDNLNYSSRLEQLEGEALSTVDFPIDIRNRNVRNANGEVIGKISDLLYDVQSKKVRYVILDIGLNSGNARQILAPIGVIVVDNPEYIEISSLSSSFIEHLPDYMKGQVNPGVENMVRLAYLEEQKEEESTPITGHPETIDPESFYSNKLFSTTHLFNFVGSAETVKKVQAVFDDGLEAESAITELLAAGFNADDVELSSTAAATNTGADEIETPSVANGGSLISIRINNSNEALRASEILNKNGSVSIFEQEEKSEG
ncbi:PRC-barrel domain-containing protein [Desertivirga arenae]|uniref:PRC-barrel domain-containing protein n=1 Tax=Desertivirga arenae TaxID=2810309 RepID=UPI001A97AF62|nr:PRC-barrel domain-containing protein [Pedobacter sp. SYSU D00823]